MQDSVDSSSGNEGSTVDVDFSSSLLLSDRSLHVPALMRSDSAVDYECIVCCKIVVDPCMLPCCRKEVCSVHMDVESESATIECPNVFCLHVFRPDEVIRDRVFGNLSVLRSFTHSPRGHRRMKTIAASSAAGGGEGLQPTPAESELEVELDALWDCAVCSYIYFEPVLLRCGHSFCKR